MVDNKKDANSIMSSIRVPERYEVKKLIGSGAYGQVVLALDKHNKN